MKLIEEYHFVRVFIWNKSIDKIETGNYKKQSLQKIKLNSIIKKSGFRLLINLLEKNFAK